LYFETSAWLVCALLFNFAKKLSADLNAKLGSFLVFEVSIL